MKQYISKSDIIAEMEKLKAYLQIPDAHLEAIKVCDNIISVVDTLEVKEENDSEQPQSIEYYDPYKAVVESIAEMCVRYDKANHSSLVDFYDNVKVKCKDAKEYDSLFPREQWKPSKEQIMALRWVLNNVPYNKHKEEISGLLDQIKDL